MAKLFKDKIIHKNLSTFDIPDMDGKIVIVNQWLTAYKNKTLHQKTESQCEQAFNQSFFVELLGYTTFPNETYTLEPKGRTEASGQKPDAVLGWFTSEKSRTVAVVEIKDVNTALDRSQKREGNLSPVQQAFKYKPQYKECDFVIAANFFEIRLHKDNQLDYEQFTLETLADPKDDHFQLRKFYYLLCADNFISKTGKSKTEALLSDIRIDQESITKKFYQEYKQLRQELIKDIVANNAVPKSELMMTIEKAQKIIDRIVFVCFCEDTDLLPQHTLQKVIQHAEKSFSNHWDTLKGFFNAVDKGSEKLEIPDGYNGGLFAEDQVLNNLKISDSVCKKFLELGNYDFSEDLSVNILGHIFEQSISDIEEIKAKAIEGEEVDKKKSKRKKDGIFYTPDYIVDYIVKNSLGKYLEEKELEIKAKNNLKEDINDVNYKKRALASYVEYQAVLRRVKVLDPACGSGAFLVKVFDYLLAENKRVASIIADLHGDKADLFSSEQYIKSLLENNIYGVDLNAESVEITKLSLWLKSAEKGRKLVDLNGNIKCGNSLIDDPEVAGDKAFKWGEEFKGIMDEGGFDVIVGNPPYVNGKNGIFTSDEKGYFHDNFSTAQYQLEIYVIFIEKSLALLKNDRYLGLIVPTTWMSKRTMSQIRKYLLENSQIKNLILNKGVVFEDASVETLILTCVKSKATSNKVSIGCFTDGLYFENYQANQLSFLETSGYLINYSLSDKSHVILNKIEDQSVKLDELFNVISGVKEYQKGKGIPPQTQREKEEKVFNSNYKISDLYKPEIRGKNTQRYYLNWQNEYLKYGKWIAEPRDPRFFVGKRILLRKIPSKKTLVCVYTDKEYIVDQSVYIAKPKEESLDMFLYLAILNSKLIGWFYKNKNNEFDDLFPQIKISQFKNLPLSKSENTELSKYAKRIQNQILELSEKIQKFLKLIQNEYQIEKISRKLQKFYQLDFEEFLKALKLTKISLDKKAELLDFFEKNKAECLDLKTQIDSTDAQIDEMVFDLYGLTEEERKLVMEG